MALASEAASRAYVWDLPTRLFHWLLVIAVVSAFVTAKIGGSLMLWHGRIGLTILGLLAFRIAWGMAGSTYARFVQFVKGPAAILAYLRGQWQGLGHNPVGALSVLALLATLGGLVATGLFANDDIAFRGYLTALVDSDLSERITRIHHKLENFLVLLVILHVGAIAFYARVKKHNLVKPMITGWADGNPQASATGGGPVAFIVAACFAATSVWAASGALLPPPPPPPAAVAPSF